MAGNIRLLFWSQYHPSWSSFWRVVSLLIQERSGREYSGTGGKAPILVSVVPASRFLSSHISGTIALRLRVFSFLVTGDMYYSYCPGQLDSFQEPAKLRQIFGLFSLSCPKSPFLVYGTLNMGRAESISAVSKNGDSLPFGLLQSLY